MSQEYRRGGIGVYFDGVGGAGEGGRGQGRQLGDGRRGPGREDGCEEGRGVGVGRGPWPRGL